MSLTNLCQYDLIISMSKITELRKKCKNCKYKLYYEKGLIYFREYGKDYRKKNKLKERIRKQKWYKDKKQEHGRTHGSV